ncbi:MAG: T9SS type A sorting domain-containing protein [Candidatus Cloacimonetes bacterium]|nr:T9SS type A sorting domain-containing protein [Candidatus Cloacimonadota bacterium]
MKKIILFSFLVISFFYLHSQVHVDKVFHNSSVYAEGYFYHVWTEYHDFEIKYLIQGISVTGEKKWNSPQVYAITEKFQTSDTIYPKIFKTTDNALLFGYYESRINISYMKYNYDLEPLWENPLNINYGYKVKQVGDIFFASKLITDNSEPYMNHYIIIFDNYREITLQRNFNNSLILFNGNVLTKLSYVPGLMRIAQYIDNEFVQTDSFNVDISGYPHLKAVYNTHGDLFFTNSYLDNNQWFDAVFKYSEESGLSLVKLLNDYGNIINYSNFDITPNDVLLIKIEAWAHLDEFLDSFLLLIDTVDYSENIIELIGGPYAFPYSYSFSNTGDLYYGDYLKIRKNTELIAQYQCHPFNSRVPHKVFAYDNYICWIRKCAVKGFQQVIYEQVDNQFQLVSSTLISNDIYCENEDIAIPQTTEILKQNYPNPFNPKTLISFELPESKSIKLEIYNLKGQKIKSLIDDRLDLGYHKIFWYGDDDNSKTVSSGIYFYTLSYDDISITKKCVLLK